MKVAVSRQTLWKEESHRVFFVDYLVASDSQYRTMLN